MKNDHEKEVQLYFEGNNYSEVFPYITNSYKNSIESSPYFYILFKSGFVAKENSAILNTSVATHLFSNRTRFIMVVAK